MKAQENIKGTGRWKTVIVAQTGKNMMPRLGRHGHKQ
jgi:long-subunit acyl-CoA synthetase (AMP-forming)